MRALVTLGVLWCGLARAEPSGPMPGYVPGEAFTYKFSIGVIDAGRARMSVGYPASIDGRRVLAVAGDAHSASWFAVIAKLDDQYKVILDAEKLFALKVASAETGIRTRAIQSELDGRMLDIAISAPLRNEKFHRRLPGPPRDPVGSLFALRAARLADGDVVELLALDGAALYRGSIAVAGREELTLASGKTVRAIRLDALAQRIDDGGHPARVPIRAFRIFLSDDDARIPWRISGETDLGEARLELTSYVPPRKR
jgi:hypothetical protein